MRLLPYSDYKSSGIEWLGEVPAHWKLRRVKSLSLVKRGASPRPIGNAKYFDDNGEYAWVRIADVTASNRYLEKTTQRLSRLGQSLSVPLQPGSLILSIAGSVGKPIITDIPCCIHDGFVYFPHLQGNVEFLYRIFSCGAPFAKLGKFGTQLNLNTDTVGNIYLSWPPETEQVAITRFLDHTTSQIESYIRTKEKLIALLEEQKQVLIHDAVTGRIDVRTGKPHPTYKPSGMNWLPNIPALWEVRRSKQVFWPRKELAWPEDVQLSATQAWGVIRQEDYEKRIGRKVVRITQHLEKRRHVEIDDFVISMRSFQGGLERARATGCIRSSYVVLRATAEIDYSYFKYLFKSMGYIEALRATANFIRDGQDLNFDNFCQVDLPFPPIDEQQSLAVFLDNHLGSLSSTIERTKREIALVEEYRTRLIADVVKGKLDVREAAKGSSDVNPPMTTTDAVQAEPNTPSAKFGSEENSNP